MVKEKNKKCVICGKEFLIEKPYNRKTCSAECSYKLKVEISKRNKEKIVTRVCKNCNEHFSAKQGHYRKFCSIECQIKYLKENRKKENNPNWKGGFKVDNRHLRECSKYKKSFIEKNGSIKCELCGTKRALRFETHHIVFASEAPKHKELHNHKNLILLCIQCHNNLHKKKILRNKIVEERNLNELFGRNLIIYPKKQV